MADKITVTTTGERRVVEFIERLRAVAGDTSPIWREIGQILYDGTMERFDRERTPEGAPWQRSWRALLQGGKTLQSTGRLRDSITLNVQGKKISVGTNVKYAPVMQFGAVIRAKSGKYLTFKTPMGGWAKVQSVKIPARPFLGLSKDDEQAIILAIESELLDVRP